MSEQHAWDFPNPATAPGSAAYYVVRFSPPAQQHMLARWYAWFELLDEIVAKAKDPGVARLKLDWWREEADKMLADSARHPLAQALQSAVTADWQVAQIRRALDEAEQRILRQRAESIEGFLQQGADRQASRLRLLCEVNDSDLGEALEKLGRFCATVDSLANLADEVQRDHLPLPKDLSAQAGLSLDDLQEGRKAEQLAQIGEQLLDTLGDCDHRYLASLKNQSTLHPALRHSAQRLRLAQLLRKHGFGLDRRHSLTPLGWLWRARRMR